MSWMRKPWMKWMMPIGALALVAVLVTGGLALTGGAAVVEDDDWDADDWGDENPAYSELAGVMPLEEALAGLYSIELSEAMVVTEYGGEMFEVAVIAGDALLTDLHGVIRISANVYYANAYYGGPQWLDGTTLTVTLPTQLGLPGPPVNIIVLPALAFLPNAVEVFEGPLMTLHPEGEIAIPVFTAVTGIAKILAGSTIGPAGIGTGNPYPTQVLLVLKAEFCTTPIAVVGEAVVAGPQLLVNPLVVPGSVTITDSAVIPNVLTDPMGTGVLTGPVGTGTIDYNTGALTLGGALVGPIGADYEYIYVP